MQLFEKARPDDTLKTVDLKENHKTHMESGVYLPAGWRM